MLEAVWDQGLGWQTEVGYGMEDLQLEVLSAAAGLEEVGRKRMVCQAGRSLLGEQVDMAQLGRVQGQGVQELWPALDCRSAGEPCHS